MKNNDLMQKVAAIREELCNLYEAEPTETEIEEAEASGNAYDLYSYFNDVLDIEYIIDAYRQYRGVRIAVALGGPNIYIETRSGRVVGYWGTDSAEAWIPSEICEEIDAIFSDWYTC